MYKECNVELETIQAIIQSLESSKLKKLTIKQGDFELHLEKESEAPPAAAAYLPPHYQPPRQEIPPPSHPAPTEAPKATAPKAELPGSLIKSPMVGTFYASPAPDQPQFVKVGDRVEENTVVCIIEAMKVMNEVKAGVSGTLAEVLLESGQPVEFGSKMFRVT